MSAAPTLEQVSADLAAARALLAEILASDEASIAELKALGFPDVEKDWELTDKIRTLLGVKRPAGSAA